MAAVYHDVRAKDDAMERLRARAFVIDGHEPQFSGAQGWIEECSRQVMLPINFCGSILIMRICRRIVPVVEQTDQWVIAVQEAAAAYDLAFLALAHADDEADLTLSRGGEPTRFVTHPNTRAVDGVNLLLSGITAMHDRLERWPNAADKDSGAERHPLSMEVMEALLRALREASFPIVLDRTGLGHCLKSESTPSGLHPIIVDDLSLSRVQAYVRHRAHTYFMRAAELAALLAGYRGFAPPLEEALDDLFRHWGVLGAATDDLDDLVSDFAAGIHSLCAVLAHLCVAEDATLRPTFRRNLPSQIIREQRDRLGSVFGAGPDNLDPEAVLSLLEDIELRRALIEHLAKQGESLARAVYKLVRHFAFDPQLMVDLVSVVARDPEFGIPQQYRKLFELDYNEMLMEILVPQAGQFIASYIVKHFWPTTPE